jgi:hypothetical protein
MGLVPYPAGPGTRPFDYFKAEGKHWKPVPGSGAKGLSERGGDHAEKGGPFSA